MHAKDSFTPPVAYPLKPAWIHDLLILWRRRQLLALLLEQATDYTATELRSAAVRRQALTTAAALFVETRGKGKQARTLTQNVWATYSRNFPAEVLAPAFLVHLVGQRPLAYALAAQWVGRCVPGETLDLWALLSHQGELLEGERPGELDALMRTLQYFGVLAPGRRGKCYTVAARLSVAPPIFPLLVWEWWQRQRTSTVDLAEFSRSPLFTFVETGDFEEGWQTHPGKVWTLVQEAGAPVAQLLPTDRASFVRALLNLISKGARRGRHLPRESEPPPVEEQSERARKGMLRRHQAAGRRHGSLTTAQIR